MRIARFSTSPLAAPAWGWLSGDRIGVLDGSPFGEYRREEATLPLSAARLAPPVVPGKIVCVARNYLSHVEERQADVPSIPLLFLKPPSTVIGPGQSIRLPPQAKQVDHEAELAVVIGLGGRWIRPEEAQSHILGYTIANDVTARDLQERDGQWTRAKGFDTFCPLGPWIETDLDPADALITCTVNGQLRQMGSTRDMIFPVRQLVAFISSVMTLDPGDVILSGTPAGVATLADGDEIAIEIEGIGTLTNPVRADTATA